MRRPRTVLVVDDEELFTHAVRDDLAESGLDVATAGTGAEALRLCRERSIDVVMLDQRLPDTSGPELCPALLETNDRMKIIFMTAYPNFENAMEAIRAGAFDYLSKPCELEGIQLSVKRCFGTLELERALSVKSYRDRLDRGDAVLIGERGGLADVARLVNLAAKVDSPVLVTGETGTGKSLIAKAIHFASPRRSAELISVNCAAFPEALIEAELFGHEKGAFTGAVASREGLVEMADSGTLFLDEIGEMPLALQTRLLHVLEDRIVRRVGGRGFRTVDFRLIAATNGEPEEAIRSRRLRGDLYYRLNVLRIHVPPLRERAGDIPELVAHILAHLPGGEGAVVPPDELARLATYAWPGNVRELRNVLERSVLLHRGGPLQPSSLLVTPRACRPASTGASGEGASLTLRAMERRHVDEAVARANGNLTHAARALGISVSTLRRKVNGRTPS